MINFSKVARQLDEEPRALPNPPGFENRQQQQGRFNRYNDGGFGTMAEDRAVEFLKRVKPGSSVEQLGDSNNLKTDILMDRGTPKQKGISVKATKDPSVPVKVNSANSQVGSRGSFTKMMMPGSENQDLFQSDYNHLNTPAGRDNFLDLVNENPAARAYLLSYGLNSRNPNGGNFNLSELFDGNTNQRALLERIGRRNENPFISPEELKEEFPEEFEGFMNHLNDNKGDIFNQMVRQHQSRYPSRGYKWGDDNPIDLMMHLTSRARYNRVFTDEGENRAPTKIDIRDVSDSAMDKAMNNLQWFNDDDNFYMAPEETDDWNKRLLDINPMTARVNRWGAKPGVDRKNLNHQPAIAQPGRQVATMGIDEGMLTDVFGKPLYSADVYGESDPNGENERITKINRRAL